MVKKRALRLSREEWLARALEVLAAEGGGRLRIQDLVEDVGVTKGSFYWHFEDRRDFVRSLVTYWGEVSTVRVVEVMERAEGDAADRLLALMETVVHGDYARWDLPIRAWAAQDVEVADLVAAVDQQRFDFVRGLFRELGFRGAGLEARTWAFVSTVSLELQLYRRDSVRTRLRRMRLLHGMLTKR